MFFVSPWIELLIEDTDNRGHAKSGFIYYVIIIVEFDGNLLAESCTSSPIILLLLI